MKFGEHEIPSDVPHPCAGGQVDEGSAVVLTEDAHPAAALPHGHPAHHFPYSQMPQSNCFSMLVKHKGLQRKMNYIILSYAVFEVLMCTFKRKDVDSRY